MNAIVQEISPVNSGTFTYKEILTRPGIYTQDVDGNDNYFIVTKPNVSREHAIILVQNTGFIGLPAGEWDGKFKEWKGSLKVLFDNSGDR